ncbi:DUF4256 domain-containing protein [Dehalococcoides sp. THU3]|uniref:DUF4256 domain-containing protein n=1 Tax=Dehalococcoides TaxID=61434 RepID=UPI0005B56600|nr:MULTISPECIES: DUF4256 domain-containing protein [Dehalococcoides]QYY57920.1 DUF4256 domain-containing protein [Dehalococcoides mccartyi]BAQ34810.1 hypothetical protein UCH007_08520 [Dehalococcoides sp. UCH007]
MDNNNGIGKELSADQRVKVFNVLKTRFEQNTNRHKGFKWGEIEKRLAANAEKLWSLNEMEKSGGEPDVIDYDKATGEYIFYDCSAESPEGRRKMCYDGEAAKKRAAPGGNVVDAAQDMGIELLTEGQYRQLQEYGNFDTKTESWLKTPPDIRKLGGAVFADYRYGHVFVFHNSATSWYSSRGFRGLLRV